MPGQLFKVCPRCQQRCVPSMRLCGRCGASFPHRLNPFTWHPAALVAALGCLVAVVFLTALGAMRINGDVAAKDVRSARRGKGLEIQWYSAGPDDVGGILYNRSAIPLTNISAYVPYTPAWGGKEQLLGVEWDYNDGSPTQAMGDIPASLYPQGSKPPQHHISIPAGGSNAFFIGSSAARITDSLVILDGPFGADLDYSTTVYPGQDPSTYGVLMKR